jgi:hypothetical protein
MMVVGDFLFMVKHLTMKTSRDVMLVQVYYQWPTGAEIQTAVNFLSRLKHVLI